MAYNIQVSKGNVKKLAGNFGTPQQYNSKSDAKTDLAMLVKANKELKVWENIEIVKAK